MFEILWPLIVFGFLMWLIDTYVPMEDRVKGIVRIGAGVLAVGFLLSKLGIVQLPPFQ